MLRACEPVLIPPDVDVDGAVERASTHARGVARTDRKRGRLEACGQPSHRNRRRGSGPRGSCHDEVVAARGDLARQRLGDADGPPDHAHVLRGCGCEGPAGR